MTSSPALSVNSSKCSCNCDTHPETNPNCTCIVCPDPSLCQISHISSKSDTVHYLSPVTSRSLRVDSSDKKCVCESFTCECFEQSRLTEFSSEYEFQYLERTLAIIKPQAIQYEPVVVRKIIAEGFAILGKKVVHLTPEQASEFCARHYGQIYFPYYVVSLSDGPLVVLCITAVNAVTKWRDLIGTEGLLKKSWFYPRSMLHRFGAHEGIPNVLYGSEDVKLAYRDIRFFFPQSILEPLLVGVQPITDFLSLFVLPTLSKGLAEMCKRKPMEPLIALAEWLLENNPYQPIMKKEIAHLPT